MTDATPKIGRVKTSATTHAVIALLAGVGLLGCAGQNGSPTSVSTTSHNNANTGVIGAANSSWEEAENSSTVTQVDEWLFDSTPPVPGKLLTTRNFRVFTTTTNPDLAERVPVFMEAALAHYTSAIATLPAPSGSLELYRMANRPQWERLTQKVMGDEAGTYLRIERGGFTARSKSILWDIGRRDTFSIAAHEGWHLYTQRAFRDSLPIALEEGLATYMEGFRWNPRESSLPTFLPWANGERFGQLRDAVAGERVLDIDLLLLSSPQELMSQGTQGALDYYAQVWALVHFLMEGENGMYREPFRQLLQDTASGALNRKIADRLGSRAASVHNARRRGVDVLSVYTGVPTRELDASYKAFVKRVVKTGSGQRIWRGESPIAEPTNP